MQTCLWEQFHRSVLWQMRLGEFSTQSSASLLNFRSVLQTAFSSSAQVMPNGGKTDNCLVRKII